MALYVIHRRYFSCWVPSTRYIIQTNTSRRSDPTSYTVNSPNGYTASHLQAASHSKAGVIYPFNPGRWVKWWQSLALLYNVLGPTARGVC